MPFCGECGYEMKEGAKFCLRCGSKVKQINAQSSVICPSCGDALIPGKKFCANCGWSQDGLQENRHKHTKREEVFEGDIHKCPNCGEIVNSFSAFCTTCGYEFKNNDSSDSIKDFMSEIENIEKLRNPIGNMSTIFGFTSNIDIRKIDLIKNFPIPNNKEDIVEFLVLSSSNIDSEHFVGNNERAETKEAKAWYSKFEQTYKKAHLLFSDDSDFLNEVDEIYFDKKNEILDKKNESKRSLVWLS